MIGSIQNETFDLIHAQAHGEKIAEPRTWAQTRDKIVWENVLQLAFFHVEAAASLIVCGLRLHSVSVKWATIAWIYVVGYGAGLGVTAGAHRLWTHRTYKANLLLRIILMLAYSGTGMNSIFDWVKDHRGHQPTESPTSDFELRDSYRQPTGLKGYVPPLNDSTRH